MALTNLLNPAPTSTPAEPPTREETPHVSTRLMVVYVLFILVVALFISRVYKLTVLEGPKNLKSTTENFLRENPLIAPRGKILDRHGEPMVVNQPLFDVEMSPYHLTRKEIIATTQKLAAILGRPKIADKAKAVYSLSHRWDSVSLVEPNLLTLAEVLPVQEQSFDLPGVTVTPQYQRCYPAGSVAGLVTGYVGAIGKKKIDYFMEHGYLRTEKVGCLGAERTFESILHGEHGHELLECDAHGRPHSRYISQAARPGNSLVLTIDMGMQRLADALLEGWNGTIVAMDPRDGSVLAMAARPNYHPDDPMGRHTPKERFTTFNKATRTAFPPGSTFKIITAAAGLAANRSPLESFDCDGKIMIGGYPFPCWLKWGHGHQDMYDALKHSCNVFFYNWSMRVGAERMIDMASAFGFGERTDCELVTPEEESPGKLARMGVDKIYQGSVMQMGIGQGDMIGVTTIQMARAYSALCNGGKLFRPRVVKEIKTYDGELIQTGKPELQSELPLTKKQREQILDGLWRVVHEEGGTGSHSGIKPEWRVAGKSGTAQTRQKHPPNAWFICFAPFEAPEILLAIQVEEAGHGGEVSAPLARQLLAYYFGQPEPVIAPPPKPGAKPVVPEEGD